MVTIDTDLAVIGAGPVGLFAAYYAGFRGLRSVVIDSLTEVGGQVSALYPEKVIEDIAGMPGIKGLDLIANLREQADRFSPEYLLDTTVISLEHEAEGVVLETDRDLRVRCKALIIAAGIGRFTPRPLAVGDEFHGNGLSYFVTDLQSLAGQDVVIVGGGDSAFDWAIAASNLSARVTLVHRRDRFRAHAASVDLARDLGVSIRTFHEVTAIEGDSDVERVTLTDVRTDEKIVIPAGRVIAALGFAADLSAMRHWGLTFSERHVVVDSRMWTGLDRVYAAGDLTEYAGKVRLIAVGFGEAATAVNNAAVRLDPSQDLFPGHSTDHADETIGAAK